MSTSRPGPRRRRAAGEGRAPQEHGGTAETEGTTGTGKVEETEEITGTGGTAGTEGDRGAGRRGRRETRLADALVALRGTSDRLSRLSRRSYHNPYTEVQWPSEVRPEEEWFSSPEYLSLYGTPLWPRMDEAARRRLAFHEAANFFSLNIHGEKILMQGLAARLYRRDLLEVTDYLHHFLDEENKHSVYFGGFCTRYAKIYRSRQFALEEQPPRDVADFLFFARTMVFEEIVDHYNLVQARDERLHPLARFINDSHHVEEARHLVFGRRLVRALWESSLPDWDAATVGHVRRHVEQFFAAAWREYYHPDVYADAGLGPLAADPWETAERAWSAPAQRRHRREVSRKAVRFLTSAGVLTKEPADAF